MIPRIWNKHIRSIRRRVGVAALIVCVTLSFTDPATVAAKNDSPQAAIPATNTPSQSETAHKPPAKSGKKKWILIAVAAGVATAIIVGATKSKNGSPNNQEPTTVTVGVPIVGQP